MKSLRSQKQIGQPTRGKTAANRLRRVDNFILLYEPSLLTRADSGFAASLFVDLGYGFDADEFQTILPKNYIHHMVKRESIFDFSPPGSAPPQKQRARKLSVRASGLSPRRRRWRRQGYKINLLKKFLSRGWLIWYLS